MNVYASQKTRARSRKGFTLIELVTVIVILGILSAVALPIYLDYKVDAQKAATKGILGGVRAGIANAYAFSATESGGTGGILTYPTIAQLTDITVPGAVMQDDMPENPYNGLNTVTSGTTKGTPVTGFGWVYNETSGPGEGQFWAATDTVGENNF